MTKGERDFNNFLLTPDGMTFEGKYDMPIINGMKMKKLKEPKHFVEFHCLRRIPIDPHTFSAIWYGLDNYNVANIKEIKRSTIKGG